jgi:hypothetical protein
MVPLVWRSKPAIYYVLASQSRLAGLDVYQVISSLAALLLALAVLGFFLVAREILRAPPWLAVAAAGLVGLDRMVLHTVMHPYFNQTWGLMTLPFALVLAHWAARQASLPPRGGLLLLGLFLLIGAFAYPLMLPIPLLAVAVWLWERRNELSPRRFWRGPRSLLWAVPVGALLILPIAGVIEKSASAVNVIFNPGKDLGAWGGDLTTYYEEAWFFGLPTGPGLIALAPLLLYGGWVALDRLPRRIAHGFVAVLAFAAVFAIVFRLRDTGFYFHFKILAFTAPLALLFAVFVLGCAPQRVLGLATIGLLAWGGFSSANSELGRTFDQLPKRTLELQTLTRYVPPGDSIRLDIDPQEQNWAAFMLHERPLCSQHPLLNTSYPHVRTSRKADFIVRKRQDGRPDDADGPIVAVTEEFILYREDPTVPGRENCSQRMVQTVTNVDIS